MPAIVLALQAFILCLVIYTIGKTLHGLIEAGVDRLLLWLVTNPDAKDGDDE